ncbi:ATP-binding cassette domain-containing protein [Glutamicibacter sp. NPDC087344]|uniref:ATP-binding cassette domain-containing protein n=1 Tax=Glutamicibacter sp. NPDC087344 TaxID=3363994 RepID=UPI00382B82E4
MSQRAASDPFLSVKNLTVEYSTRKGVFRAVDDVSFDLHRGTTLAVVGESGCGKSTVAKSIMRLLNPAAGQILLDGTDLVTLNERALRPLRRKFQMVFQDPYGSLDPRQSAEEIITEPLKIQKAGNAAQRRAEALRLLDRVGLPESALARRANEFSGGQRQRIGIARALASKPELLVCDEATSALDVSVQAQVIKLLAEIQADTGISYLFITHNLGVVQEISDRVLVMRRGQVVEIGETQQVLSAPSQEYTRSLRRAALDPSQMSGLKPRHLLAGLSN